MSTDNKEHDFSRREFLTAGAGAAGAMGLAAAGLGMNSAQAAGDPPPMRGKGKLRTNSKTGVRTAIVTDTQLNMGPYVAKEFAERGYNLVIADVQKGLEKELKKLGAKKVVVVPGITQDGAVNEGTPGAIQKIVDAAMSEFGGYDSVFIRTAWHGGTTFLEETTENMQNSYEQNCLAVMYALQAVVPPLVKAGGGQVVVQTSATGEKPHPGVTSYSVMRAAANMMCRCAALEVADKNVTINAVGTNFMNYPGFKHTLGADKDPKIMADLVAEIPVGRLGETREAAHFAMALLDGYNMYTTAAFYSVGGGFNYAGM